MKTDQYIFYVDSQIKNTHKAFKCNECMEADEKLFKVIKLNNDFNKKLDRIVIYFCEFHAKEKFPYFFKSKSKSKSKNQLALFEVEI